MGVNPGGSGVGTPKSLGMEGSGGRREVVDGS